MKNKLFFTVFLSFLLLFSLPVDASSQTDAEVIRLKKIFDIGDEFDNFDVSKSSNPDNFKSISYEWSNKDSDILVTTDDKGNIFTFSKYTYTDSKGPAILKNKEDIIKVCNDFLDKIDPNLSKKYELASIRINFKESVAFLSFDRTVNGLEVINDNIQMQVDLANKSVYQFTRTYSSEIFKDNLFPNPKEVKSKEDALKKINKERPFYLSYLVVDKDKEKEVIPVYSQLNDFFALDGIKLNFIDSLDNYGDYKEEEAKDYAGAEVEKALSPVEEKEIGKIKGVKSLDDAKKFISKNFDIKGCKIVEESLSKNYKDDYAYFITYESDDYSKRFILDAKDLNLLSYSYFRYSDDKKSDLKTDDAIAIAKNFIEKFNKNKDIDLENPFIEKSDYATDIRFYLKKNDHYVYNNYLNITISNSDKIVTSYGLNVDDIKFEKMSKDLIDKNKANEIVKENLKLVYAYVKDEVKLLYLFDDNDDLKINAKDGNLINDQGKTFINKDISYKNIDDSKYKDEILYLTSLDIGLPGDKDLKEKISVVDYIYLLNCLSNPVPYDKDGLKDSINYYEFEDLNKEKVDNNLLRADAVKWLMNQNSYRNLKDVKDVFDSSVFKDSSSIPKEYKAYYYIAKGLAIYDYDKASPKENVSIEEALHFIYKSL